MFDGLTPRENRPEKGAPAKGTPEQVGGFDLAVPFPRDFRDRNGKTLEDAHIRLRVAGRAGAPAIFVLGGISAGRFVADEANAEPTATQKPWWAEFVCAAGPVDLNRFQVISADFFPLTPTQIYTLTSEDYAQVFVRALEEAGIAKLHAIVGASFGGMIAQEIARLRPDFIEKLVILCAADRPSPMATAWRRVQREIISLAIEAGDSARGVSLARELAMTTYRTAEEFNGRFDDENTVTDYLVAQGEKFAQRFSAERYVTLSAAIDTHNGQPRSITTPSLVIAVDSDRLVPLADVEAFAASLKGETKLHVISSRYGHDAFLKEKETIGPLIHTFLQEA